MVAPERQPAEIVRLEPRRRPARALAAALRPRQWTKNLLVLAGIVFAAELGDPTRLAQAVLAFAVFCAVSSAAYLVNDVRDAEADRRHRVKRRRPVARGELSERTALGAAAVLAAVAAGAAAALGPELLALVGLFAALQLGYTLGLKRLAIVDVLAISGLFVLRAAAGAVAVDVPISPWLLLCTGLLALFLAFGKRRAELAAATAGPPARPSLEAYSLALVDQLLAAVVAATVVAYALYTITARDERALLLTVPFVVFGLFRYLLLLHRRGLGEEPENVLLTDAPILLTVAAWTAACAAVLALS